MQQARRRGRPAGRPGRGLARRTANSSPPVRTRKSRGPSTSAKRWLIWMMSWSPTRWPRPLLTTFRSSMSSDEQAGRGVLGRVGQRLLEPLDERGPVGQAREAVAARLLPEQLLRHPVRRHVLEDEDGELLGLPRPRRRSPSGPGTAATGSGAASGPCRPGPWHACRARSRGPRRPPAPSARAARRAGRPAPRRPGSPTSSRKAGFASLITGYQSTARVTHAPGTGVSRKTAASIADDRRRRPRPAAARWPPTRGRTRRP